MAAKMKLSYEKEHEIKEVIELLDHRIAEIKIAKNQTGKYKKAYIFLK